MDELDPVTAASLDDLAACLRHVHRLADSPSFRILEDRTKHAGGQLPDTAIERVPLRRTTLSDMLQGRLFPRKAFLLTFVEACGVDLEADPRWKQAWDRLAVQDQHAYAPLAEVEKLRHENEELRRQLSAVMRPAETAEDRTSQEQAHAQTAESRLDMATRRATIAESPLEWERKYISVNPKTGAIDVYDRSIAIQVIQDNIGQSYD